MTISDSTYRSYPKIEKFMCKRPSLIYLPNQLLKSTCGADQLREKVGLSHLGTRNIFPLDYVEAHLCLRNADMNDKNSNRTGWFSPAIFYSEAVELLNDLHNIQKNRDANYPMFMELLEVEFPKGIIVKSLASNSDDLRPLFEPNEDTLCGQRKEDSTLNELYASQKRQDDF